MQRANHTTIDIGEQHRHTIRGEDAEYDAGRGRDQSVAVGSRPARGVLVDSTDGFAMDLR